ncbi:MAG: filamentous hemagglutinin N-terminal domain-containing protein [Gammaproteobacteria bacterium]|nr:filamentous hemagglutinin N-terminal domain-containing protein [Gammaproteobacteria bacterium]
MEKENSFRIKRLDFRLMLLTVGWCFTTTIFAEVVLDGSMKTCEPNCALSNANPESNYDIQASYGIQNGNNLFHSFDTFNLNSGEIATFSGPSTVQNIVGRVTGGSQSSINGTIRNSVAGADLWLINPAGIVFGADARLDVSGSFHASTADYIKLGTDGKFGADILAPANTVLTSSPPSAFGFLDNVIAPISIESSELSVPAGKTLSFVAGDVSITGQGGSAPDLDLGGPVQLRATSGQINLISVGSAGEAVKMDEFFDTPAFTTMGKIHMHNGAAVTTRGDPAGTIYIRAGEFVMENAILDSGNLGTSNHSGNAIDINVKGKMQLLSGVGDDGAGNVITGSSAILASSSGAGNAGDIVINASELFIQGDPLAGVYSVIATRVFNTGNSGNIFINSDILQLDANSLIVTQSFGEGDSKNINIDTKLFTINGTQGLTFVSTSAFSGGSAGNLTVKADELIARGNNGFVGLATQVTSDSKGSADTGLMDVIANKVSLYDGAQFNAAVFSGSGSGATGGIKLNTDELVISGKDANGYSAGIFTNISGTAASSGGNISINANELVEVSNGGQISSEVGMWTPGNGGDISLKTKHLKIQSGGKVTSSSFGTGAAGNINIIAENVEIDGVYPDGAISGIYSSTSAVGAPAGNIDIIANQILLTNGARISSQTFGMGSAGLISIETEKLSISGSEATTGSASTITASSEQFTGFEAYSGGAGGEIVINASDIELKDKGQITTHTDTDGNGGIVIINTGSLTMSSEANISADSSGNGTAGDIKINAKESISLDKSSISSESAYADGGNIHIESGNSLNMINSEILASVEGGAGSGGSITIDAINTLLIRSDISASSNGSGVAGDIRLTSRDTLEMLASHIATEATQSDGGNINIYVQDFISMDHSSITASVSGGDGNGGNIYIDPELMLVKSSNITANAHGGKGGNVTIIAGNLISSPDSIISASSSKGIDGNVIIDTPSRDIFSEISLLPETMIDPSSMFRNDCAAVGGKFSSFIVNNVRGQQNMLISPSYFISEKAFKRKVKRVGYPDVSNNVDEVTNYAVADVYSGNCYQIH